MNATRALAGRAATLLSAVILCAPSVTRAEPTRVAWSSAEGTSIPDLAVTDDGRYVAFIEDGSANVRFLDLGDWEIGADTSVCTDSTVGGLAIAGESAPYEVYVGCGDGTLAVIELDEFGETTALYDENVTVDEGQAILAVEPAEGLVYVIAESEDGDNQAHVVEIGSDSATVDGDDGYPSTFGVSGFEDSHASSTYIFVAHGGDEVSKLELSSGSISNSTENLASRDFVDMYAINASAAFLADTDGGILRYNPSGNDFYILLDSEDGLESNQALAISDTDGDAALVVYDAGPSEVVIFDFDTGSLTPGDTELQRFEAADIAELVTTSGYVVGGGSTGELQVLTDRPWVEIEDVDPSSAVSGDSVSVQFSSDTSGDWELYLGGTVSGDGDLLASGELEADELTQASITVSSSFAEGVNKLWLLVSSSGLVGHDRDSVSVDNPPGAVTLSAEDVGFGNQQITVSFEGIEDADLDHYTLYCTTSEFDAGDYETGGPEFDGDDEVEDELPREVSAEPGADVTVTILPLTNDVTYYVAVRAYDEGGQEGEMSNVLSAMPQETVGAAELAGEQGGYCGTRARAGVLAVALGAVLLGLRRRRSGLAVLLALLWAPGVLAAADEERPERERANVELRYGPYFPTNEGVTTVYGSSGHQLLLLEGGAKLGRFFEVDLGAGFYQELGTLVSVDDDHSSAAEHTMLTAMPLTGSLALRLDIVEEQILVPHGSMGMDYWLWRENWYVNDAVGGDSELVGGELGWHWSAGLALLLDRFDAGHASKLENSTGIDDTYLVAEFRQQRLGMWGSDGQSLFDGSMVTIGLKLDM